MENLEYGVMMKQLEGSVEGPRNIVDLYSNNSIRLIGINPIEEVDDLDDEGCAISSDTTNLSIDVNQVYKNKNTLSGVMRHYTVSNNFNSLYCVSVHRGKTLMVYQFFIYSLYMNLVYYFDICFVSMSMIN